MLSVVLCNSISYIINNNGFSNGIWYCNETGVGSDPSLNKVGMGMDDLKTVTIWSSMTLKSK